MQEFTVHLSFTSFLKTSLLIGFCFGVCSVPLVILLNYGQAGPMIVPMSLVGTPFAGTLYGLFAGIIGYPLYHWLSSRIGFKLKGNLYVSDRQ
jgi:uncharacterized membrane protein YedE/YeeE